MEQNYSLSSANSGNSIKTFVQTQNVFSVWSVCADDEFKCNLGNVECVSNSSRFNRIPDCQDGSDEGKTQVKFLVVWCPPKISRISEGGIISSLHANWVALILFPDPLIRYLSISFT